MKFEFATAPRIIFGRGAVKEIASMIKGREKRVFLVTGNNVDRASDLLQQMKDHNISVSIFSVPGEPTTDTIIRGLKKAKEEKCRTVIAFGGGSVIDAGKAISAMMTNEGELMDYLEVIGRGKAITQKPAPSIAIPTTAGTGSEVTKNAVLLSPEHKVKVSMRHIMMIPDIAVIDPELTLSVPPSVTASTGLDALTQVIEPFLSSGANPVTDAVCREGIMRAARSLRRAYKDGPDIDAREDMCLVSLFGGMALANAKLGAIHGFAGPLGGMFPAPHGTICAKLLPFVMRANVKALKEREPRSPIISRFVEVARILTGNEKAGIEEGLSWLEDLCFDLAIPPLSQFGVTENHIEEIVEKSKNSSSMKGNPVNLTEEELREIIKEAI